MVATVSSLALQSNFRTNFRTSDIEVRDQLRRPRRNSESAKDGAGTVYATNMG